MSKRPEDRYQSAASLADDVRRWLADEPIVAFREPWPKRLARWSKRHRTAVASAAALLVTTVIALSISTVLIGLERDEARRQRRQARQAVDDMYTMVAEQWLEDRLDPLQRQLLEKALAYYENFSTVDAADPIVRQERGRALLRLGDVLRKLGRHDDAESAYRRSIEVLSGLADAHPGTPDHRVHLSTATTRLAMELASRTKKANQEEAERLYRRASTIQDGLLAEVASNPRRLALARTERGLADLLRATSRPADSESAYRRSIAILERATSESPAEVEPRQELAAASDGLGVLLKDQGRPKDSEVADRKAIDLFEKLMADAPTLPQVRDGLAKAYNSLGLVVREAGSPAESEAVLRKQVALNERLAEDYPARPEYRRTLARGLKNLGLLLRETNRIRDAEAALRRSLEINEKLAAESPEVRNFRRDQAICLSNLGELLSTTTRRADAEAPYRKSIAIYERLLADSDSINETRASLAGALSNLGLWLAGSGRLEESLAAHKRATDLIQAASLVETNNPNHRRLLSKCLSNLGDALMADSRHQEAEEAYRKAVNCFDELASQGPAPASDRLSLAICLSNQGANQVAGKLPGGDDPLRRSLTLFEGLAAEPGALPLVRRGLAAARTNLGDWLATHDRPDDAVPFYVAAAGTFDALMVEFPAIPNYKADLVQVLGNHAELRIAQKRPTDARPLLELAVKNDRALLEGSPRNPSYRDWLRGHLELLSGVQADLGAHAEAAAVGDELVKVAATPGTVIRGTIARLMLRCASLAEADSQLSPTRRATLVGSYHDRAIALIRQAVENQDPDANRLLEDDSFAPLRDRDGFKTLRVATADDVKRPLR